MRNAGGDAKQLALVIRAIRDGCETAREVAEYVAIDRELASARLSSLAADGVIRIVKKYAVRYPDSKSPAHIYGPAIYSRHSTATGNAARF